MRRISEDLLSFEPMFQYLDEGEFAMSAHQKEIFFDVLTPVNSLSRSASIFSDKTAVVHEDKRYTYQEFYDRVNRLASALTNAGIGKGDKVAFVCPNIPPMLEAHFAVPMIGAALVSINIRLSPRRWHL